MSFSLPPPSTFPPSLPPLLLSPPLQYIKGPHTGLDGEPYDKGYTVLELWGSDWAICEKAMAAVKTGAEDAETVANADVRKFLHTHTFDPNLDMSEEAMAARNELHVSGNPKPAGEHDHSKDAKVRSALSVGADLRVSLTLSMGGPCRLCRETKAAAKARAND